MLVLKHPSQLDIELFGKAPTTAATDRDFDSTAGEQRIKELGVHHAAIPKPGDKSTARTKYEQQRWFKRARAWHVVVPFCTPV